MHPLHTWFFNILASLLLLATPAFAKTMPLTVHSTPQSLPKIEYKDATGALKTLDFSASKLTAVHLWATWCAPCVTELPEVDALAKTYADKRLAVIAISLDANSMEKVKKFFADHRIGQLTPYLDHNHAAFRALSTHRPQGTESGLPNTVFFNNKGEEIARIDGPADWKSPEITAFIEKQLPR